MHIHIYIYTHSIKRRIYITAASNRRRFSWTVVRIVPLNSFEQLRRRSRFLSPLTADWRTDWPLTPTWMIIRNVARRHREIFFFLSTKLSRVEVSLLNVRLMVMLHRVLGMINVFLFLFCHFGISIPLIRSIVIKLSVMWI